MARVRHYEIEIDGQTYPVKEYRENRRGARFSFGKDAILFRLPLRLLPQQEQECLQWFQTNLTKRLRTQPELRQQYQVKTYQTGQTILVGTRQYVLDITHVDKKSHSARLIDSNIIQMRLANGESSAQLQKSIKTLLSRIISADFKPILTQRVLELNDQFFQKKVYSVNLKYNQSNWGSCSSKGNLNFSSRLLFAPQDVIDYVIIHELAHLIEMNHSPRFWQLVARAMPNYKEKEAWLKKNRVLCDF